jgi:hypothetical protein
LDQQKGEIKMGKLPRSLRGVVLGLLLVAIAAFVASVATSRTEAGPTIDPMVEVSDEESGIESIVQPPVRVNADTPEGVALVVDRTDDNAAASACTSSWSYSKFECIGSQRCDHV